MEFRCSRLEQKPKKAYDFELPEPLTRKYSTIYTSSPDHHASLLESHKSKSKLLSHLKIDTKKTLASQTSSLSFEKPHTKNHLKEIKMETKFIEDKNNGDVVEKIKRKKQRSKFSYNHLLLLLLFLLLFLLLLLFSTTTSYLLSPNFPRFSSSQTQTNPSLSPSCKFHDPLQKRSRIQKFAHQK